MQRSKNTRAASPSPDAFADTGTISLTPASSTPSILTNDRQVLFRCVFPKYASSVIKRLTEVIKSDVSFATIVVDKDGISARIFSDKAVVEFQLIGKNALEFTFQYCDVHNSAMAECRWRHDTDAFCHEHQMRIADCRERHASEEECQRVIESECEHILQNAKLSLCFNWVTMYQLFAEKIESNDIVTMLFSTDSKHENKLLFARQNAAGRCEFYRAALHKNQMAVQSDPVPFEATASVMMSSAVFKDMQRSWKTNHYVRFQIRRDETKGTNTLFATISDGFSGSYSTSVFEDLAPCSSPAPPPPDSSSGSQVRGREREEQNDNPVLVHLCDESLDATPAHGLGPEALSLMHVPEVEFDQLIRDQRQNCDKQDVFNTGRLKVLTRPGHDGAVVVIGINDELASPVLFHMPFLHGIGSMTIRLEPQDVDCDENSLGYLSKIFENVKREVHDPKQREELMRTVSETEEHISQSHRQMQSLIELVRVPVSKQPRPRADPKPRSRNKRRAAAAEAAAEAPATNDDGEDHPPVPTRKRSRRKTSAAAAATAATAALSEPDPEEPEERTDTQFPEFVEIDDQLFRVHIDRETENIELEAVEQEEEEEEEEVPGTIELDGQMYRVQYDHEEREVQLEPMEPEPPVATPRRSSSRTRRPCKGQTSIENFFHSSSLVSTR